MLYLYIYTLVLNNGSWHLKLGFAALGDKDDLVLLSLPSEGLENLGGLTLTRQLKVFHNVKGAIFCCRYSLIFQWQTKRQRDCNRIFVAIVLFAPLSPWGYSYSTWSIKTNICTSLTCNSYLSAPEPAPVAHAHTTLFPQAWVFQARQVGQLPNWFTFSQMWFCVSNQAIWQHQSLVEISPKVAETNTGSLVPRHVLPHGAAGANSALYWNFVGSDMLKSEKWKFKVLLWEKVKGFCVGKWKS